MKQQPISMKMPISSKHPSLIFSTRKIEKSKLEKKGRYAHTIKQCGPIVLIYNYLYHYQKVLKAPVNELIQNWYQLIGGKNSSHAHKTG